MAARGHDSPDHGMTRRHERRRPRGRPERGAWQPADDGRIRSDHDAERLLIPSPASRAAVPIPTALRLLREGSLDVIGRIAEASNATLYCRATGTSEDGEEAEIACVYKPVRGERPLWDFPVGTLANREYAAFLVSEASGWGIVPPTLLRDGPFGWGMVQLWVDVDEEADVVGLVRRCDDRLRPIALFDVVVNNADRKGAHLLPIQGGHVHGVDHGICFAVEPKLRTILWGWRGTPIAEDERDTLSRLREALDGDLGARLRELLSNREVALTTRRLDALLARGIFPQPDPDRPAIPWPPF